MNAQRIATTAAKICELFSAGVPAVVAVDGPLFEAHEVFEWIIAAHPAARENTALQKIRALKASWGGPAHEPEPEIADPGRQAEIYANAGMLLDAHPHLPRDCETFEVWVARVGAVLGRFGMQAPGIECASWEALHRLQSLLAPVLRETGPRTHRYNAFLGDYARTPFGFHIDPHQEAVFQYVITGHRRALFWEGLSLRDADADWVEDTTGSTDPARAADIVLELAPGDLVYWPGTYVHGMEPKGPSLALSMVVDRASPRTRADVVSSLETATQGGAVALPPVGEPYDVRPHSTLVRHAAFPVCYERHDDVLLVGVCGRTFDWPDTGSAAAAMRLLDAVNASTIVDVEAILSQCVDDTLPAGLICEALGMLVALGFFAVPAS
ncbi:MAG: hypothetical protein JKY37_27885 [Nannocystaceae bacterium]|nr:hypothetical protein [Nannocystaceae bacterium]